MNNRHKTMRGPRAGERGAALVVAIAIMTILFAIALTFYGVSRQEMDNATNVRNTVQAELLVDGTLAMVMAELNRDFLKHPNATSTDFRPFVYFNGAWAAGKQWALRNGIPLQNLDSDGDGVPDQFGVPLVDLTAMPVIEFSNTYSEQMYSGPLSQDWLYYPRFEGSTPVAYGPAFDNYAASDPYDFVFNMNSPDRPPFVTPAFFGPSLTDGGVASKYPLEWIDSWTDEDNDGDGLRDSIWIPLPQDKFFSGGEVVNELTGARMFDDGIDNNLNGMVDENQENGQNEDLANEVVAAIDDPDEAMEFASFVYYGGDDGLDNDNDGLVDDADPDEQRIAPYFGLFLAAPLPGISIPVDFNADGVVPDLVPDDTAAVGTLVPLTVILPAALSVQAPDDTGAIVTVTLDATRVDRIDNDLDQLINDFQVYAYVGPNTDTGPPFRLVGFEVSDTLNPATLLPVVTGITNAAAINSRTADPTYYDVWRLVGNWEAGDDRLFQTARLKAYEEINVGSAFSGLDVVPDTGTFQQYNEATGNLDTITIDYQGFLPPMLRITHSGEPVCDLAGRAAILVRDESSKVNANIAGGHNYNVVGGFPTRSLGAGFSTAEYETRVLPAMGVVNTRNLWTKLTGYPDDDSLLTGVDSYDADVALPGYGRVDDNANIMLAALNGVDDDGDGLIDEGLYLPALNDPLFGNYYALLGDFEGNDEPGELQRYRPKSNLIAEGRNPYQLSPGIDALDNDLDDALNERGEFGDLQLQDTLQLKNAVSPPMRNLTFADLQRGLTAFSTDRNANFVGTNAGVRAVNKLDYNFATPQQIAANLLLANPINTVTATRITGNDITNAFAAGLLQGDVHIRSTYNADDTPAPADPLVSGLMWTDATGSYVPSVERFPADPVLQAMQTAVDIVDYRDAGHSRSVLTSEKQKTTTPTELEASLFDTWPNRLSVRERIAEEDYFPLEEIQAYLNDVMDVDRQVEFRDDWWTFEAGVIGQNGNVEQRKISYTVSGNEAIRINELMVRPVRRVEAEAVPSLLIPTAPSTDPMFPVIDPAGTILINPLNFDPQGGYSALPAFDVIRSQDFDDWVYGGTTGFIGDSAWIESTSTDGEILQFRIRPTDGLPPGRYYLTVDTLNSDFSAVTGMQLEYLVKYGAPIAGLGDAAAFVPAQAVHYSANVPGAPAGWVFIDGTANEDIPNGRFVDGGGSAATVPTTGPTFTVTVGVTDLYIGFRKLGGGAAPLRINALDFSQEPDHEWIELANVSDQAVDVGGWELEVGIPERGDDVPPDPFKSRWRIPPGTTVAPQGMVLLGFDKYDHYQRDPLLDQTSLLPYPAHRISDNGMGLARSNGNAFLSYTQSITNREITVPPIVDISPAFPVGSTLYGYNDLTGSVFYRQFDVAQNFFGDYIDRDGDGVSSVYFNAAVDTDNARLEQSIVSSTDGFSNPTGLDLASGIPLAARPWDRIIQLDNLQLGTTAPFSSAPINFRLSDVQGVDDVAALVLRGGVLPDYPERDGIDNDGDGGYVQISADGTLAPLDGFIDPTYIPGTLDRDMVDNDGDGLIDERGDALINDGVDDPDPFLIPDITYGDGVNARLSEGVDEGFGGLAGAFTEVLLPIQFFNNRSLYPDDATYFNFTRTNVVSPYLVVPAGGTGIGIDAVLANGLGELTGLDPSVPAQAYLGSNNDPPDWKAFAERRWYPGDNVIVTLYEDEATKNQVVDRVTYREYDVTNRTIDDVALVPYLPVDADGSTVIERDEVPALNTGYPTFWMPNHMALDFYRSLERKHPLYNGDRFGTSNRWEATDGNYDDWADSLSYFQAELESAILSADSPYSLANDSLVDSRDRFSTLPLPEIQLRQARHYRHAMAGTPLRMNTAARMSENPRDLEGVIDPAAAPYLGDPRQFPNPLDWFRTHEDGDFAVNPSPSLHDQGWNHRKAFVANRRFTSAADLMNVTHQTFLHDAVATASESANPYLRDMTMVNYGLQGDTPINDQFSRIQNIALRGATLGQDAVTNATFGSVLTAAVNSMAQESSVLTVGQAEFHPIRPDLGDATVLNAIGDGTIPGAINWLPNPLSTSGTMYAPASWAPVFLFDLNYDTGIADTNRYPYYPSNVDGFNSATLLRLNYLFRQDYLSSNMGAAYLTASLPNHYEDRWPLEWRTTMYVSEVRPNTEFPPAGATDQRPEGLFIWDGEDGLENGEYVLYVGTYIPGLRDRAFNAAGYSAEFASIPNPPFPAKPDPVLLYNNAGNDVTDPSGLVLDRVTREVLYRDPTHPDAAGTLYDPVFALDVITDPSEAKGVAPRTGTTFDPTQKAGGLIHPDDWKPTVQYRASDDGYIFYGNNAAGGWRPQIVRVTDNFLALRVRNVGELGQVGVISHIVLAPRKRTPGRVNVNTTTSRKVQVLSFGDELHSFMNPLLGLPGVVDVATSVVPSSDPTGSPLRASYAVDDDISNMEILRANGLPWATPAEYVASLGFDASTYDYGGFVVPPARNRHINLDPPSSVLDPVTEDRHLLVPPDLDDGQPGDGAEELHRLGAFRLLQLMEIGRTERADGRYYASVGDLASDTSGFTYNYSLLQPERPLLAFDPSLPSSETNGADNGAVYPLSNESNPSKRFDEVQARFRRLGNLVTARSDVYEIIMTVEAGYGVDRDGDGFINYRDPREFVTTSRKKASAVYERRAPSDQIDGAE